VTNSDLSPCKKICTLDTSGSYCTACKRTIQEIAEWSTYPTVLRLKIMAGLPSRRFKNDAERFE